MAFVSPQAVCLILERLVACGVLHAASRRPAGFVQAAGPPSFLRQPAAGAPVKVRFYRESLWTCVRSKFAVALLGATRPGLLWCVDGQK